MFSSRSAMRLVRGRKLLDSRRHQRTVHNRKAPAMVSMRPKHAINPGGIRPRRQPLRLVLQTSAWLAAGLVAAVQPAGARSMDPGEAAILRQVAPAVVSISVWKVRDSEQPGGEHRR